MASTSRKACESVMTSRGLKDGSADPASSWATRIAVATALWSRMSRIVWTWGSMSLPFGASASSGITSTTVSPCAKRSPTMGGSSHVPGREASVRIDSISRAIPSPVAALTYTCVAYRSGSMLGLMSILLTATMYGIRLASSPARSVPSGSPISQTASTTTRAISALLIALCVRAARASANTLSSSIPGVSMKTTGPSPCISMALYTMSVVVPATGDTTDTSCPHMAFIRLDLPAFILPSTAM